MKPITKKLLATAVLALSSFGAQAAGSCGAGKITQIKEGGWGSNDFLIKIDYTVEAQSGLPYYTNGYIRFLSSLDESRFDGIKALVYLGFSSGRTVKVWTSGTSCAFADDLTIYAPGVTL